MYGLTLLVHSWLRWAVLAAGLIAVVRGGSRDERAGKWFTILLDVQLLVGLLLYFALSPVTGAALDDFGGAMKVPQLRFFAVEHVFGVLIGTALAHVGRARVRKARDDRKARVAAIFYGLALLAILASIPWPGLPAGRPLFRF
ncbi:MAG TPA: hypothetical protein VJ813_07615 [Vicinamibacterales bacterium]|nr:hypothetical protein [Vicinamibacterales bacterium]